MVYPLTERDERLVSGIVGAVSSARAERGIAEKSIITTINKAIPT